MARLVLLLLAVGARGALKVDVGDTVTFGAAGAGSDPVPTSNQLEAWEPHERRSARIAGKNEDGVFVLDSYNFDATLDAYPNLMVQFMLDDAHGKQVYGNFTKAAAKLLLDEHKISDAFAVVTDSNLIAAHRIRRAQLEAAKPVYRVYTDGRGHIYGGSLKSAAGVAAHTLKAVRGACQELATADAAAAFVDEQAAGGAFVGFGRDAKALAAMLQVPALAVSVLTCAVTASEEVAQRLGVDLAGEGNGEGELRALLAAGPRGRRTMDAAQLATADKSPNVVASFVFDAVQRAAPVYDERAEWELTWRQSGLAILLVADADKDGALIKTFQDTAARFRAEADKEEQPRLPPKFLVLQLPGHADQAWGLAFVDAEADAPTLVAVVRGHGGGALSAYNSSYDEGDAGMTAGAMRRFFDDVQQGTAAFARRPVQSQRAAELNKGGEAVVALAGTDFERRVHGADGAGKDVLVEFYAPWCGHCNKLKPQYEQLAQDLKHVKSVVIAKMDATANRIAGPDMADITGFPTVKLYPAFDKQNPVRPNVQATHASLLQLIKVHAHVRFTLDGMPYGRGLTPHQIAADAGEGLSEEEFDDL